MRSGSKFIHNGAVVSSNNVILAAGPLSLMIRKYPSHRVYSLQNSVLMPGLVNLHTHLELPPLLESIRARSLPDWVLNLIFAKKNLSQQDFTRAASDNINDLIRSGTTSAGEICTHGASPSLLKQSGLRAVVFREIISMGPLSSEFKVQSSTSPNSGILRNGISPHSPYTVSQAVLLRVRDIARKRGLQLAMHIAESKDEIKLLRRQKSRIEKLYLFANWDLAWAPKGSSSFAYLDNIGFLSPDLLAVHAVQVDDHDIDLIKKSGSSVAHCPRSNKELGVGRMPLKMFLDAGITVGLGTDSLASVRTLNLWDEMRYAYRIHRRDGISAEDIFRVATIGGAKALGLNKDIGTIEPGKKADIIVVPLPKKNTGNLYNDLLRETKSCIMNMVNGKILYREGQG
jgi:cytosine/adenosine deaminase-related metal-dependent hydrolase